uniref:Uncharacterized protein n=1 Tax=Guillardia theta TaxID=55529 RepID=A0A7S4UI21_GUITH|mmetsp:Transcript_50871/g.158956  ORF Transcript_50871/g.158956 Transcript_50871/m.158956 type:complete len:266 (+) Transcript_50871:125-922(+)
MSASSQSTHSENGNSKKESPVPQLEKPKHRKMAKGLRSNFLDYLEKQISEKERLLELNLKKQRAAENDTDLQDSIQRQNQKFRDDLDMLQKLLSEQREALIHETVEAMEARKAAEQSMKAEAEPHVSDSQSIPVHHRNRMYRQLPACHVNSPTLTVARSRADPAPTVVSRVASAYCSRFTAGVANPILRPLDSWLGRLSSFFYGRPSARTEARYPERRGNGYPFFCCGNPADRDSESIPERVTVDNRDYYVHRLSLELGSWPWLI